MKKLALTFGAACLSLIAGSGEAAVIFSFEETGGDVVGTLSGSLDVTNLLSGSGGTSTSGIGPAGGNLFNFTSGGSTDTYAILGPSSFGTGVFSPADASSGSDFGIQDGNNLFLPIGYTTSDALTGTLSFTGETFASLGITPGDYVYSLPNDTITLRFGSVTPIPLPATLPLLIGALGAVGFMARRRSIAA